MAVADDRWLPRSRQTGNGQPVVCFAPAGAGAGFFRDWAGALPGCRLLPVQLPGREERFSEAAVDNVAAIAGAVAATIIENDVNDAFLLGYSYGALLAFETAVALEAAHRAVPGVIACARAAPQTAPRASVAELDDDALLDYVANLGGVPAAVLREDGLADIILPVLRADFRANDYYASAADRVIAAPITAIIGNDDAAVRRTVGADPFLGWGERTKGLFAARDLPGGHFFILEQRDAAFAALRHALELPVAA